uniref:Oxysterol-binding protein n=1 Tax=Takifugu rubripes TaxID=31033 RepID=Q1KKY7_TAKRU|nr:oxysterol-binding protein-like protein 7 [Takifugu rubripes]
MNDLHQVDICTGPGSSIDLSIPGICEGYLMKRRKYPLKGWHKRYFLLEKGILKYSKTQQDIQRGKLHGSLDISSAVLSINKKAKRIDLDAGDNLYHLKVITQHSHFSPSHVYVWFSCFILNRTVMCFCFQPLKYVTSASLYQQQDGSPALTASAQTGVKSKVSAWLQQTHDIDATSNGAFIDCTRVTECVNVLRDLKEELCLSSLSKYFCHLLCVRTGSLSARTDRTGSAHPASPLAGRGTSNSASVKSIPDYVYSQLSSSHVTSPEAKKLHQEIYGVSQRVHASLKSVHDVLTLERERVRHAWTGPDLRQNTSEQLATLCSTLTESRLTKVHSLSLSSDSTDESFCTVRPDQRTPSLSRHSHRPPSVADSMVEYFDASDVIPYETSSEAEASDESGLSDITTTSNSEPDEGHGRRTTLPAPGKDNSHIGIMTILYNNIGKDLSRVSMPVALNEPVSLLQRLSEELEYTDLLDIANHIDDPYERMVYVAVFSISGYAWASWRYRYKPFNPVLGETYESHREDRGFHYVSEQVSHHPPISACHAESENFTFWQDQRWKNKFWGKSVEIISSGLVNVTLPRYGDHYEWNKAVTCIHNVLNQQRWLEHYGEVVIRNKESDVCTCKITFVKSRYWSSDNSKNEVQGVVLNRAGEVVHRFGGLWHEGIFCDTLPTPKCIWKPNEQPEDFFDYYGFSTYARELNELTPELEAVLPPTDTRFRPDQRLLEQGKVEEADKKKDEVEEKQRERRKEMAKKGEEHVPRFFRKEVDQAGKEVWLYKGTYWQLRRDPGFANTDNLHLW